MKLFRLVWRHPSGSSSTVFWSHDKSSVSYWGHLRAEYATGLSVRTSSLNFQRVLCRKSTCQLQIRKHLQSG